MHQDLTPGTHLLWSDAVVGDRYKLTRNVHRLAPDPYEPIMVADKPWEGQRVCPLRVIHENGLWRMWYRAIDPVLHKQRKEAGTSPNGNVGPPVPMFICYAESDDGVKWRKDPQGVCEHYAGENNIVFTGYSEAAGGILDLPGRPHHKRFVLANCEWLRNEYGGGGITIAHSDDGIHWEYLHPEPVICGDSDTHNNLVYDAVNDRYLIYMRAWHAATVDRNEDWVAGPGYMPHHQRNVRRRVAVAESKDLLHWSEPQIIMTPDELETNDYYGLTVFNAPGDSFGGFLWVYDDDARETIHVELTLSNDGVQWWRPPHRPKFIDVGEPGWQDGYMVFVHSEPIVVGDDMYIYWKGLDKPHDVGDSSGKAYRGKLRRDGLISLDANRQLGAMITRPFTLESESITINAATQGGALRAELVEPWNYEPRGKTIEGFTMQDSDPFTGDAVSHTLSWKGKTDLSALRGKRLMLRIHMYHAQLYTITL